MKRRENTFRIDYANVPKKPTFEEVHEFVGTVLGMKRENVQRIQCSRSIGCAFVKVNDLEVARKVVADHDNKHEIEVDGKCYKLRLIMEDGAVDVKLFDLSEDVTNDKIINYLAKYGEVLSITELLWDDKFLFGGIPTGVRVARMLVKINIPSYVNIDGEVTTLSYYGQQQTCRHCTEFVHNGISCIQNKKLLVQKLSADKAANSYANVVMRPPTTHKPVTHKLPNLSGQKNKVAKNAVDHIKQTSLLKSLTPTENNVRLPPTTQIAANADTENFKLPTQPSAVGLSTSEITRRVTTGGRNDEEETDDSTTSSSSRRTRRQPNKKTRHLDDENTLEDSNTQQ